ncbi:hypothetical protein [Xenorhabdus nematophila]|uniref:hypothetical protein n=1 Tax=Xenorhabdus nematophila TaxID=628 RepID=UPI001F36B0B2|nr:hypothetical protein [Xenorhabdus nematophila]
MFKKLLTIGALAAGVLFAGTASANVAIHWNECYNSPEKYSNGLYTKYVVKNGGKSVFNNVEKSNGITWYFKGIKKIKTLWFRCSCW